MQQTEKYKLNLIESSDPFLPDALNQNTQKVEDAMTAHEAAVDARMDATDQRVTVLEGRKLVYGWYSFTDGVVGGKAYPIMLGFTPKYVLFTRRGDDFMAACESHSSNGSGHLRIIEGGFEVVISGASGEFIYLAII